MPKAEIIKRLIDELGISIAKFERKIGVTGSSITKAIERNSEVKDETVQKIKTAFPEVNPDWLETGKGGMFLPDVMASASRKKEIIALGKHKPLRLKPDEYSEAFGDWPGLPMFNTPVTASFVETYRDETLYKPQYYLHDPRFRDCDFGAIITGDSMHSEIRHGDFIACKEITDKRFIVFGDIYYVVATNGLETCKYVNRDPDNPNNLLLVPKNENISKSPIPKDMILRLYKVRGIVRGY